MILIEALAMCAQVGLDQLDQNAAVNKAGAIVGKFAAPKTKLSDTALQPYDEVFGLQRFRETELIHGRRARAPKNPHAPARTGCPPSSRCTARDHAMQRPKAPQKMGDCWKQKSWNLLVTFSSMGCLRRWAMLAALGVIVAEASTGVSW